MNVLPLFSETEIKHALIRMAEEIRLRLGDDEDVLVIALLNGALWFAADLLRLLPENFLLDTMRVSSYKDGMVSGDLECLSPIPDVVGKRVLLLDDVLDTGKTLYAVRNLLLRNGARCVLSAVAVDKRACRQLDFQADFVGIVAEDAFLLGYGLDVAGRYRNLPFIAEFPHETP